MPAMVLLSGWAVMLVSRDSRFPISLPASWDNDRWKPVAVVLVGQLQSSLLAVATGMNWKAAVLVGLKTAMWTFGLYSLVIKAIFGNKVPKLLLWLAAALPKPQTPAELLKSGQVSSAKPPRPPDSAA